MRFLLDEGVPVSVAAALETFGHEVFHVVRNEVVGRGSPDRVVSEAAIANDAILVAFDGDMRQIARSQGVTNREYKSLSLLKFSCLEPQAVERLREAMSIIEHEWNRGADNPGRRMFIEIGRSWIKTNR